MKAIILAAGIGSRLGNTLPKCLTRVNERHTILDLQVESLRAAGIEEITAVVGFKKEIVMEHRPDLLYLYNPLYHLTNTARSLALALSALHPDNVIWLNGDVVFDPGVITAVIGGSGNAVAVDRKSCGEEEVKYSLAENGCIARISKQVGAAAGEAVGVNLISHIDFEGFRQDLWRAGAQDYFEKAIELAIDRGIEFRPVDISEFTCIEVDDENDLQQARRLISSTLAGEAGCEKN